MNRHAMDESDSSVDLTYLRSITEGDRALEEQLFQLFFETSERCIAALDEASRRAGATWQEAAHELKGASASIGASEMRDLCMTAETLPEIDTQHRLLTLARLRDAYERVKLFYAEIHP